MGNKLRVEVRESCKELQHRLRHANQRKGIDTLLAENQSDRYKKRTITKIREK